MKTRKERIEPKLPFDRRKLLYIFVVAFLFLYLGIKFVVDISQSLFFARAERINFVIYGEYPVLYSLGIREAGDYAVPFYPDLKAQVPGGYGYYRLGALGKLVKLDNKPEIFTKTFSSISSTFVTYYFYEESDEVYYGGYNEDVTARPGIRDVLLMKSNASFWDRIYLISHIQRVQPGSVSSISYLPYDRLKDDTVLRNDTFLKKYIGLFYNKTYRNENLNVQIIYSNRELYNTAEVLVAILNGSGIVVGDVNREDSSSKKCNVIETPKETTITARNMASFFGCELKKGETGVYDILFVLGELEKTWEVQ